jgi:hypothetical protein
MLKVDCGGRELWMHHASMTQVNVQTQATRQSRKDSRVQQAQLSSHAVKYQPTLKEFFVAYVIFTWS